jgi:GWxTD domain-containing protein
MRFLLVLFFVFSGLLTAQSLPEQVYFSEYRNVKIPRRIPVIVRTLPEFIGKGIYRIYVLSEIQYDYLQFLLKNRHYESSAEIEVILKNINTGELRSRVFKTTARVVDYSRTNRRDLYHFTCDSIDVPANEYEVIFNYRDVNVNQRNYSVRYKINLAEVENFFVLPPVYVYPEKTNGDKSLNFSRQPSALREHWGFNQAMGIELHTWQLDSSLSLSIEVNIYDPVNRSTILSLDTLLYEKNRNRQLYFSFPANFLSEGQYQLEVNYKINEQSFDEAYSIYIDWFDKPWSLWNIQTAIEPLEYLLDEDKIRELRDGNENEQRNKFNSFWRERDPSPTSPFNELKAEYYTRVDSANVKFSLGRRPGWKTEIGKIYILNGPPDEIQDRSLAPIDTPYLKWTYYQNEKKINYIFLATNGRKNYKLIEIEEIPL